MNPDDRTLTSADIGQEPVYRRVGKYRILSRIGQGGMGVVYRAVDDDLGRAVALKFIPPHLAQNPTAEQRFLREARAASALDHVNIGTIFGIEDAGDQGRFIVMAYYEGRSLGERMRDKASPVAAEEALSIAIQIARGLNEAHARGIVHRDIKPSNILITKQGVVKVVDFGLANMQDAAQLTQSGVVMGTPDYMSPEQAQGRPADHRTDIWSLGVVLCEMLTGEPLFESDSVPAILYKVVHGALPSLESVNPALRPVLEKALEREPANRYQSMGEFLAGLEALAPAAAGGTSLRGSKGSRAFSWSRLRRWLAPSFRRNRAALAAVLLLAALTTAVMIWKGQGSAGRRLPPAAGITPNVYDKYLQGLELVKRWDKGDNLEQAIGLFSETTRLDPKFALGFARLADAQRIRYALSRKKPELDEAARNAEEAMRLNPNLAPVQVAMGRVHALRGNNDLAFAAFENALRLDWNDPEANQAMARQYEKLGRLKDAETAFQRSLSLDPDSIATHDAYGNFLFRQTRHEDAIREWRTVIRLAPDNAAAFVNLGSALTESGRIAEAITMYQRAVELKPGYMAYTNLGTAFSRARRYQEAADAYQQAIRLNEADYLAWGNLAYVYSWMNGPDTQTRATFDRAVQLAEARRKEDPRNAFTHSDLALYYAKLGKRQLAAQRLDTALALAPKGPEILAAAAEVFELLGQRAKGVEFARRSLESGFSRQRLQRNPELASLLLDPSMQSIQSLR